MRGRNWKKMHNIFSIFYTHHRIPNKHMMTINFDTITNNYEVIYVIKTVMKYYLNKIDTSLFSSPSSKCGSTFICWRHYMTRFGLWIFMSKITHDFWLWWYYTKLKPNQTDMHVLHSVNTSSNELNYNFQVYLGRFLSIDFWLLTLIL